MKLTPAKLRELRNASMYPDGAMNLFGRTDSFIDALAEGDLIYRTLRIEDPAERANLEQELQMSVTQAASCLKGDTWHEALRLLRNAASIEQDLAATRWTITDKGRAAVAAAGKID